MIIKDDKPSIVKEFNCRWERVAAKQGKISVLVEEIPPNP